MLASRFFKVEIFAGPLPGAFDGEQQTLPSLVKNSRTRVTSLAYSASPTNSWQGRRHMFISP